METIFIIEHTIEKSTYPVHESFYLYFYSTKEQQIISLESNLVCSVQIGVQNEMKFYKQL